MTQQRTHRSRYTNATTIIRGGKTCTNVQKRATFCTSIGDPNGLTAVRTVFRLRGDKDVEKRWSVKKTGGSTYNGCLSVGPVLGQQKKLVMRLSCAMQWIWVGAVARLRRRGPVVSRGCEWRHRQDVSPRNPTRGWSSPARRPEWLHVTHTTVMQIQRLLSLPFLFYKHNNTTGQTRTKPPSFPLLFFFFSTNMLPLVSSFYVGIKCKVHSHLITVVAFQLAAMGQKNDTQMKY